MASYNIVMYLNSSSSSISLAMLLHWYYNDSSVVQVVDIVIEEDKNRIID